jgi:ectoine hydroxylase-related dioxygenase (phytanoyl-CoA dioxygenase family)
VITQEDIQNYQTDGVVVLRDVFTDWVDVLNAGADRNVANPSERAIVHHNEKFKGRFFEDFCNWQNIHEFKRFVETSPMAEIAAQLMQSQQVQMFHDHYLDKASISGVATPWHQDMPYYFVDGMQTVSFWVPLDSRTEQVSLKSVAGSHLWEKLIMPTRWSSKENLYPSSDEFMDMPDIDNGDYQIKTWAVNPGDVIAFNFKTVHGANANLVESENRTVSFRMIGDDAHYIERAGKTSPNYTNMNQQTGEKLREDWFPIIYG